MTSPGGLAERLEFSLQDMKPLAANFYSLVCYKDGAAVRYPTEGAFALKPFEFPKGVPNGTYSVQFHQAVSDVVNLPSTARFPRPFINVTWNGADLPTSQVPKAQGLAPAAQQANLTVSQRLMIEPEYVEAQIDYRKQRMALHLQQKTQRAVRQGVYTRELQETYVLMQVMRQELQQAYEMLMGLGKRQAEQGAHLGENYDRLQGLVAQAITQAQQNAQRVANPPPPPDYTSTLNNGIAMIRDVIVATIQAKYTPAAKALENAEVVKAKLIPDGTNSPVTPPSSTPPTSAGAPGASPAPPAATAVPARAVPPAVDPPVAKAEPKQNGVASALLPPKEPEDAGRPIPATSPDLGELANLFAAADLLDNAGSQAALKPVEPVTVKPAAPAPLIIDPNDPKLGEAARRTLQSYQSMDELIRAMLLFNPEPVVAWTGPLNFDASQIGRPSNPDQKGNS